MQQHLGNLWQLYGWIPVLCTCIGNMTGNIKTVVLNESTLAAAWKHYAFRHRYYRKWNCSTNNKSKTARAPILLHSPIWSFYVFVKPPLKSFHQWFPFSSSPPCPSACLFLSSFLLYTTSPLVTSTQTPTCTHPELHHVLMARGTNLGLSLSMQLLIPICILYLPGFSFSVPSQKKNC